MKEPEGAGWWPTGRGEGGGGEDMEDRGSSSRERVQMRRVVLVKEEGAGGEDELEKAYEIVYVFRGISLYARSSGVKLSDMARQGLMGWREEGWSSEG
jgi:hypothetical protein